MTPFEFIFSEKQSIRIRRHGLFWLIFALNVYFFRFYVSNLSYLSNPLIYLVRLENIAFFLPVSVFYAYFSIYFLLPRYILTEMYVRLGIAIALASLLVIFFSYELSVLFDIRLAWDMPMKRAAAVSQVDFILNNGLVYPLTVSGFAIGIKMAKNFYLQQKQNERLGIQKINADVQLLKSQVHPRFLFHSLQTIHDDLLNGSEKSPSMLLKLSDLLSYILYESDKKMLLEKEIELLKNYIDLEKTSWDERLEVTISSRLDAGGKYIEPLLLLPLAEYIFDNIDKNQQECVNLHLDMQIVDDVFLFSMNVNGLALPLNRFLKDAHLSQVRRRLEAQYSGRHDLIVKNESDGISVLLSLLPAA